MTQKIFITSDHAGFWLKTALVQYLKEKGFDVMDFGPDTDALSVDYPLFAQKLCTALKAEPAAKGIAICGSGIGMSIAVNRFSFIRGALVYTPEAAKLSRQHNNANVLCLGARMTDFEQAKTLVDTFLTTPFDGGRHERRVLELGDMK